MKQIFRITGQYTKTYEFYADIKANSYDEAEQIVIENYEDYKADETDCELDRDSLACEMESIEEDWF